MNMICFFFFYCVILKICYNILHRKRDYIMNEKQLQANKDYFRLKRESHYLEKTQNKIENISIISSGDFLKKSKDQEKAFERSLKFRIEIYGSDLLQISDFLDEDAVYNYSINLMKVFGLDIPKLYDEKRQNNTQVFTEEIIDNFFQEQLTLINETVYENMQRELLIDTLHYLLRETKIKELVFKKRNISNVNGFKDETYYDKLESIKDIVDSKCKGSSLLSLDASLEEFAMKKLIEYMNFLDPRRKKYENHPVDLNIQEEIRRGHLGIVSSYLNRLQQEKGKVKQKRSN